MLRAMKYSEWTYLKKSKVEYKRNLPINLIFRSIRVRDVKNILKWIKFSVTDSRYSEYEYIHLDGEWVRSISMISEHGIEDIYHHIFLFKFKDDTIAQAHIDGPYGGIYYIEKAEEDIVKFLKGRFSEDTVFLNNFADARFDRADGWATVLYDKA